MPAKAKYSHKFPRPYAEGEGPTDFANSKNYNQRLTEFIQDELDFCKIDNQRHTIEVVADNVEAHFKENLIRRFDQIQEMKMKIEEQRLKNLKRERVKRFLQIKHQQTEQSHKLVSILKDCIEYVRTRKQDAVQENYEKLGLKKQVRVSKEDLNGAEKRRVLEAFVENDEALGLLLDFISSKHLQGTPGAFSAATAATAPMLSSPAGSGHIVSDVLPLPDGMSSPMVNSTIGMSGQHLVGGVTHGYPSLASQLNYINSAKNSGSQIHNLMGSGGDGGS